MICPNCKKDTKSFDNQNYKNLYCNFCFIINYKPNTNLITNITIFFLKKRFIIKDHQKNNSHEYSLYNKKTIIFLNTQEDLFKNNSWELLVKSAQNYFKTLIL